MKSMRRNAAECPIRAVPSDDGPLDRDWDPTTSFLNAATLIYAIGAGITAAAVYVPAAFLRCGSRFSCSLSGIEPWFSVTRYHLGCPLNNQQVDKADIWRIRRRREGRTIRSKLFRIIKQTSPEGNDWFWSNKNTPPRKSALLCMY